MLRKRWSHFVAVACIALGTAAVSAVLGLVNATLLQPLPFPDAERLVRVWRAETQGDPRVDLSLPEMAELKATLRGVDAFAGVARSRLVARLPGGSERLRGEAVDADYFALLGLQAAHGRLFTADEYRAGSEPSVLLSHALWTSRYGADPGVVGRTLASGETAFRIVGVLPAGFAGSIENDVVEVWLPQAHYQPAALRDDRGARLGWTVARLAPGTSLAALQGELDALQARWSAAYPDAYRDAGLRTEPFGENWRAPLRRNAGLLLAAVFVLLAIAVSNVAALLLARALDRRRELALRSALGARRGRLARELLLETGRLALLGGGLGALAAPWLLDALLALSPLQLPGYLVLRFDATATLLVAAVLALAAIAAALVPAWFGSRVAPRAVLAGGSRAGTGRGEQRMWRGLMGAQLAMSFALLVTGTLLLRSYLGLANIDLGFRRDDVLRLALTLAPADFGDTAALPALQARLREALAAQPGVRDAGLVAPTLPPWDAARLELREDTPWSVGAHRVDEHLLRTLDIALLAGRGIGAGDTLDAPRVALVSAALAQRLGGSGRALGREIELGEGPGEPGTRYRIVGVAADVAWDGVGEQGTGRYIRYGANDDARGSRHDVYLALAQHPASVVSIAVHAAVPPETLIEPLRRVLAQRVPASALHWVSTMDEELAGEYAASRFYLTLIAAFGSAALLLAAVGLFALLSHALLRREHELGVRAALGADARRLAALVLGDGARLLVAGLAAGALLSLGAARLLSNALYGVPAHDPLAWLAAATVLALVCSVAVLWPLRRAVRIAPTLALRAE